MDISGNKFRCLGGGFEFQGRFYQVVARSGGLSNFFGDAADSAPGLVFLEFLFDFFLNLRERFHPFFMDRIEFHDMKTEHGFNRSAQFPGFQFVQGRFKFRHHHSLRKLTQTSLVGAGSRIVRMFLGHFPKVGAALDLFEKVFRFFPGLSFRFV